MKYQLTIYDKQFTVEKKGKQITVRPQSEGEEEWSFPLPLPNKENQVVKNGTHYFAKISNSHVSGVLKPLRGDGKAAEFDGTVKSPFAGRVTKVNVKAGDTISKSESLLVIEAMKMEYQVTSPVDGVVTDITISLGEQVGLDVVVAKIETIPIKKETK